MTIGAMMCAAPAAAQTAIPASGLSQMQALLQEKATRNAAQRKLDSQIHYSAKMAMGQAIAAGVTSLPSAPSSLEFSNDGLVHVDITGTVSAGLLAAITGARGRVESSYVQYDAIRAWLPLLACETIAGRPDVRFIGPADRAITSAQPAARRQPIPRQVREANVRAQLSRALPALRTRKGLRPFSLAFLIGPDTNGVKAHGADIVQGLGYTGTGVKVGVMSNGVDSLGAEQAAGRLPASVTVLGGQAGTGDEGTAMLEIVYSMAPGAQLYYATATTGMAAMASNIAALRAAGCDIIVDDITYRREAAFQDDLIQQAVNTMVAGGGLYFSSAGNSGNADSGTSGTWEGDYVDSGVSTSPPISEGGRLHSFGGATYTTLTMRSPFDGYWLQWSDPWTASCNDYDLFVLSPNGASVLASSTTAQTCTQYPYESVTSSSIVTNSRIVIVNYGTGFGDADARYLLLSTLRGRISNGTAGATYGHNAGAQTVTLAAADVATALGGIFTGGSANPVETFSSDGPRRMFYDANGVAYTPACFLASCNGGLTVAKVDYTAADGVTTGVSGFAPFYGTSAAAPHAAAIAALVKSANPFLNNTQIKNVMASTTLSVSGSQTRTVGSGIVMANRAVDAVLTQITIASSISGLSFSIANTGCEPGTYTTPKTLKLAQGANCSVSFTTPQATGTGARAVFSAWDDGPTANPRSISIGSTAATYTANFTQQYLLTLNVLPAGGGTVAATPPASDSYYAANTSVSIQANAASGYTFANFSGDLTGSTNPQNLTMNGAKTVTANFNTSTAGPTVTGFAVKFGSQSFSMLSSSRNRLPWQITSITATFSAPIATGNIASLSGVLPTGFSGLGTNTLTWTISPLTLGSFTAVLASTGANALKDGSGNPIAAFSQNIKVLYGDFNDDGYVNAPDMVGVNLARTGAYNIFADLDGNGFVDITDVNIVRSRVGNVLP